MNFAEKVWGDLIAEHRQEQQIAIISAALDERYRAGVEAMRDAALSAYEGEGTLIETMLEKAASNLLKDNK